MQPALGDSSGCVRFLNASDSRAVARSRVRPGSRRHAKRRPQQQLARPFQAAVVVAELHPVGRGLQQRPVRPHQPDALHQLSDVHLLPVGVPVDRATDRPWCPRPRLQPLQPAVDGPPHQTVDRDRGIGLHEVRAHEADRSAPGPEDEPSHALVGNEDVRAAANHTYGTSVRVREAHRRDHVVAAPGFEQDISGATHLEGRPGCEGCIQLDAVRTKTRHQRRHECRRRAHAPSPRSRAVTICAINSRSRAINADTASRSEQRSNSTNSPGANWPARHRSAVIT